MAHQHAPREGSERGEKELLPALRAMHHAWRCATPLCPGPSLSFSEHVGSVVAEVRCGCGCENDYLPLSPQDVLHLLGLGVDALFGKCRECGATPLSASSTSEEADRG